MANSPFLFFVLVGFTCKPQCSKYTCDRCTLICTTQSAVLSFIHYVILIWLPASPLQNNYNWCFISLMQKNQSNWRGLFLLHFQLHSSKTLSFSRHQGGKLRWNYGNTTHKKHVQPLQCHALLNKLRNVMGLYLWFMADPQSPLLFHTYWQCVKTTGC